MDLSLKHLLLPQLRGLADAGFEVTAISAPGPRVPELEAEGIRHIPWFHATRAWDPRADALAFLELLRILRRERFDVVHTHNPKPGVMGRIAARLAGVPVVMNTVHGLYATPEDRFRRRFPVLTAEWVASRFSDLELYQSEEDLVWARRLGLVRPGQAIHLGNGIDVFRFRPGRRDEPAVRGLRAELGIGDDEPVVGAVGRMVREKGYVELFEAVRIVRSRVPNARLLVVGEVDHDKVDGLDGTDLRRAGSDVVVAGWREDVPDLLAAMDVFVLPSWREGIPRSAIEAAATGLPVVLTDIRGCREVASDGVEGFLVPVRDPQRLSDAIVTLLEDPELRRRMGTAARSRAEERFDEMRVVRTVVGATVRLLVATGRPVPSSDGGLVIRRARRKDALAMARLHRQSLPTAFLPALGDGFLRRMYVAMAVDPEAVVFVVDDGGAVVGFAAASPSVRSFYRRFALRQGVPAVLSALPRLMRPSVLRRAVETARYPSTATSLPEAELLSIAVEVVHRSKGIGAALVDRIRRTLAHRGLEELKVVVGADDRPANRFYERMGFRPAGRIAVHEGVPSNVWVSACSC
ncbi:MAG: GNAT family N-acetyltransferase [Candidatus Velamenicoccus archaeovorus]